MIKFPILNVCNRYNIYDRYYEQIFTIKILKHRSNGPMALNCCSNNCKIGSKSCLDCNYNRGFDYENAEIKCFCSDWVDYIITGHITDLAGLIK